jgi:hypothetical protein
MNDIDKWCAEQCGVEEIIENMKYGFSLNGRYYEYQWTIQDPRCREIVRERFFPSAHYLRMPNGVMTLHVNCGGIHYNTKGKTIAEAEIACITAIW